MNGEKVTLYPENLNDFIDAGILTWIISKIKNTGYQFAAVVIDQEVFVIVLNVKEYAKIRDQRSYDSFKNTNWNFFGYAVQAYEFILLHAHHANDGSEGTQGDV